MVKRRKLSNSLHLSTNCSDDDADKNPLISSSSVIEDNAMPTSDAKLAENADVASDTAKVDGKEANSTTITRSKTAQQLIQSNLLVSELTVAENDESKESAENSSVLPKSSRTSARQLKKNSKEVPCPSVPPLKKVKSPKSDKPRRRTWEVWSKDDIDNFFDGLCECGRDFDKIQAFIEQRSKKKGARIGMTKNKDQVRHFYYRTLQKISKHIVIEDGIDKQTQELFLMVNYAKLRRKLGCGLGVKNEQRLNEFTQKLNELVYDGKTSVKVNGRKMKMKTPVCRALKRLNNCDDSKFEDGEKMCKLPADIKVLLCPKDNVTWARVQSLSMNPRIKLRLGLQRRFSDIIEFLQRRWKPYRFKLKDKLMNGLPPGSHQIIDSKIQDETKVLKITPRASSSNPVNIQAISIKQADSSLSNNNISLRNFITSPESFKFKRTCKIKSTISDLNHLSDKAQNKPSDDDADINIPPPEKDNAVDGDAVDDVAKKSDALADGSVNGASADVQLDESNHDELNGDLLMSGFTAKQASILTVGHLYLMLNKPDVIVLDYQWISPDQSDEDANSKKLTHTLDELVKVATISLADLCKLKQNAMTLGNVVACSCGHVCPASSSSTSKTSNKNATISKSPARIKPTKISGTCSSDHDLTSDKKLIGDNNNIDQNNATYDPFLKPTDVAPRSFAQASNRNLNVRDQLGLNVLRRPNFKGRFMRKNLINQRNLLPKRSPSVVTVQLMPAANIPNNEQLPSGGTANNVVRIVPKVAGQFVDLSPVNMLKSVAIPCASTTSGKTITMSSTGVIAGDHSTIISNVPTTTKTSVVRGNDILSTITASIINSNPIVSHSQHDTNQMCSLSAPVAMDTSSLPRLSIPENSVVVSTAEKLPSNISALLNSPLPSNDAVTFIHEPQANYVNATISASGTTTTFLPSSDGKMTESNIVNINCATMPEQVSNVDEPLVRPPSPVLSTTWLDSESSDYSLSNLLGSLESPVKPSPSVPVLHSSSSDSSSLDGIGRLAPDVDTQLQCLMNENSVDYVSKFADLAAHIASSDHKK